MLSKFTAFQLAKKFYWESKKIRVPPFLREQLLRASASIGLNIAEGSGKRTPADQKRFYSIAMGSLRECQAILELENIKNQKIEEIGDNLGAILYTLTKSSKKVEPKNCTETATETETATVKTEPQP